MFNKPMFNKNPLSIIQLLPIISQFAPIKMLSFKNVRNLTQTKNNDYNYMNGAES